MKPILVWGATGFIGGHLVRSLTDRGIPVLAVTRRPVLPQVTRDDSLVQWVLITEGDAGLEAFTQAIRRVDVVFNLVGSSGAVASNLDPLGSLNSNCYTQTWFLQACELSGTKPHVVFASSRLVYGTPEHLPVTEECALKPRSYYAAHKVALEHYHLIAALRSTISYTICRISNPYGAQETRPGHFRSFIDTMIDRACRGLPMQIYGDGQQLRDYVYIDDLADALIRCATTAEAKNEVINLGYGESLSILEAASIISHCSGSPITHLPWDPEAALVESGDYVVDISKAKRLLGFHPRFPFAETLNDLVRNRRSLALRMAQ